MRRFVAPVHALSSGLRLAALAGSMTACATTGLAWVHEPESGVDLTPPSSPSENDRRASAPSSAAVWQPPPPASDPNDSPSRRRLDHSVTLGGVSDFATGASVAPAQSADTRATTVNVYVTPAPTPFYGATYGFGPTFVAAPTVRTVAQPTTVMRPGLDWPAVSNHGPSFPYRTGPASPWDGERSRPR